MISLTRSAARYVGKLSNKLRRNLDTLSSRAEFSGSQGRTLHFLLAQTEDVFQKDSTPYTCVVCYQKCSL